ncbi:hypothetical protein O3M35_002568 [Rhynocoris fuscipes]|uniref:Odorant receptor n=1 Tax=Rhynocoris fuscipes TaxID=488301 RepID=A0AAW1CM86_9HEMI
MIVAEVFLGRKEFQAIVGLLSTSITCTFGLARAIRFFQRKKEIISVLDRLEILRSRMEKDEENKQFLAHAENVGRKFSTLIFVSCNSYPIASCFHVLLTNFLINVEEKELVYRVWTPWNSQEVMGNIIANIALTLMALPLLSTYAAIHLLEVTFTFYISAYVKSIENDVVNKGIGHEDVYEQHKFVIQIIRDHNKILSGIKYWEAQISPLMPCGFGYSCLKAIKKNEISIAVDYYVRATLALIPQFVNCCCGQQVTSQILQTVYSYITLIVNIDEE